ncbi:PREDICTED: beta-glucosidase 3-like isoform X2 [Tarenaya hassleriana]|uniref:beta-glucosidase 3-like isoform X2 n=1 Tax=Tarenaya hassleriana TaxID=28532 RepID=UPI00053C2BC2|nr:PREDICTED: beta-glucosidase 3-like isoform X2 [Tarenaya hassleriana]
MEITIILSLIYSIFVCLALGARCSDVYSRHDFPEGFVFGAGTSAYQWEGAANEDGRMPSIWDTFSHSHKVDGVDEACDGYHKYKEDVHLMADMSLDAYKFSISWSRLIPYGRGPLNPKALQFYKNLINELISHGIEPHVTLNHNDLPQALEDEYGGWLDRKIIKDFTAYADICFSEFGNDVKFWTTINEPNIFVLGGYDSGMQPPGRCSVICARGNSSTEPYIATHNILLAHASVARLYKQKYKQRGSVGISVYGFGVLPFTNSKDDELATQRAKDLLFGWILHPLVYGDYPDGMKGLVGDKLPTFSEDESEHVRGSLDFIGVVHYTSVYIKHADKPSPFSNLLSEFGVDIIFIGNSSLVEYQVFPWGLEEVLEYLKQTYSNPLIYILENGKPMKHNSSLHDTARVEYIHGYIGGVLNSVRNGSRIGGYFVWSFMDLYELLSGFEYSFGLYHVNFSDPNLKRSPKYSAHWYSSLLKGMTVSSHSIMELHRNYSIAYYGHSSL